ncbi:unnamed protein product [Alopecurus aequalis]
MSALLPSLAAGDAKKTDLPGGDAKKALCCGTGDHQHPKKPGSGGPSAAKLALASFLGVVLLFALDVYLTGAGADHRLRHQYQHYLGGESESESTSPSWLSVPTPTNFTDDLLARWLTPGGSPCRDARTVNISIPLLDAAAAAKLSAAEIHEFRFWALDGTGARRCLGGDFFEIDLSGEAWKSRPPVVDHGDGSYTFRLQVAPRFAAEEFSLTIVLLFRSFEGLKFSSARFSYRTELRHVPLLFRPGNASLPALETCGAADFGRDVWSGRWTRLAKKDNCEDVDEAGRYRCLEPEYPCEAPWCDGPLGALESNGWVYSAHCSFKLFTADAAWRCLDGKWLFFWGDSNHVDTIRNLLTFVLGVEDTSAVTRRFDAVFTNPSGETGTLRITSIYNGHWNMSMNYLGLHSLRHRAFRQLVRSYFMGDDHRVPDVVILNSGLHDGCYWSSFRAYVQATEFASQFWSGVMAKVRSRGLAAPRVFYRTTVATGGYARDLAFNPNKMELFNGVLVEKLRQHGVLTGGVIDNFDMTFPWHYDNRCNDGVHYGRAPAKLVWRDGKVGHQYFVDLMLGHVLLNAICNG